MNTGVIDVQVEILVYRLLYNYIQLKLLKKDRGKHIKLKQKEVRSCLLGTKMCLLC